MCFTDTSADAEKAALQRNLSQYEARIETLKAIIQAEKTENKHKLIVIKDDTAGYSYDILFGEYLGSGVTEVTIRDPYIRQRHQINCLISLLELLKSKCNLLKSIKLITGFQDAEQDRNLKELKVDLANQSVNFIIEYSETLHDRSIWLNTGWVFKMGRGLDMFKKHESRNALGVYDYRFRRCYETEINIFHESTLSQT